MSKVEQLITEHIDIWTSAILAKSTAGRGSNKKYELYGIKKLRELILELAVRGKLVPQDPNDEPASVLLEKIAAEKTKLIKEGKLKKSKLIPEINDDEALFELPQGWEKSRLGDIVEITRGITFPASEKSNHPEPGRVACLRTTNVQDEIEWDDLLYVRPSFVKRDDQYICSGDIVMSMANSRELVGKVAIIKAEPLSKTSFGGFLSVIRPYFVLPDYLMAVLRSPTSRESIIGAASQTTNIANISLAKLNPYVIGVPPLDEQQRIVAKVDELMLLCDQLEQQTETSIDAHATLVEVLLATLTDSADANELAQNWARVSEHFATLFSTEQSIEALKQTLLQLAVMGKLVPQDPNDEPAAVLLEKITAEKAQLIKDKKIKKEKPLPPIGDDEKPFELPQGWDWCRLGDLLPQFQNGASSRGDKDGEPTIVLRLADIKNWRVSLKDTRTLPISKSSVERYLLEAGDTLVIRVNGSADIVGRFITCTQNYNAIYCDHFIRMRFLINIFAPEYLSILGSSTVVRDKIANLFISTAGQKTVNQGHLSSILIPLAPIVEQSRIVTKINELINICDQLREKLKMSQETQAQLTDALVDQALV